MLDKLKDFLKPLDKIQLSQIAFAIILSVIVGKVFGAIGILAAISAIVVDVIVAISNKDSKRILSKALAYGAIFLIAGGLSKYLSVNANFSFIAIVIFSLTEIVASVREIISKIKK